MRVIWSYAGDILRMHRNLRVRVSRRLPGKSDKASLQKDGGLRRALFAVPCETVIV